MSATAAIKGNTTIFWGTAGVLGSPSGAICKSIRITPKNGAPVELVGNANYTDTLIWIRDGFNAAITCRYDTAKTWPRTGEDLVNLVIPHTGMFDDPVTVGKTTFACYVGHKQPTLSQDGESTMEIELIYRPDVA